MFISISNFFKNIIYYLISFFYGEDYLNIDMLSMSLDHVLLNHVQKHEMNPVITRLKIIDYYLGLRYIDTNQQLNVYVQRLKDIVQNGLKHDISYDLWCLYLELLLIVLTDKQSIYFTVDNAFPIIGIQKTKNQIKYLFSSNNVGHFKRLNELSLSISSIAQLLFYGQLLKIAQSDDSTNVKNNYIYIRQKLIHTYHEFYIIIDNAVSKKWFKWLKGNNFYTALLDNFTSLHNTWLFKERLLIHSKWIDPWSYLSNQTYREGLDIYLNRLEVNDQVSDVILKRWHDHWFIKNNDFALDWSDVIICDPVYFEIINKKWPLMTIFIELIKNLDDFNVLWPRFKQVFIASDLEIYHYRKLIFWQKKIIKFIYALSRSTSVVKKIVDEHFYEIESNNLYEDIYSYKDVTWLLDKKNLFLSQHILGTLKSSQILMYFVDSKINYNMDTTLILFALKRNQPSEFQWCIKHLKKMPYSKLTTFKAGVPNNLWQTFAEYIHIQLLNGPWCNASYYLIKSDLKYQSSLDIMVLNYLKELSNVLDISIVNDQSFYNTFKVNQGLLLKAWEHCSFELFRPYIPWLNKLLTKAYVSLPELKALVLKNGELCIQSEALETLETINDFNELGKWGLKYVNKTKFSKVIIKVFESKFFSLFKNIAKHKKIGSIWKHEKEIMIYQQLLSPVDYSYIKFIQKNHLLMDHWLTTMHALLLNELWIAKDVFMLNPFIIWLHYWEICPLTLKDLNIVKQIYLFHHKKKSCLSDCFQKLLNDFLIKHKPSNEMNWHDLTFINYKENLDECRTVQKKHTSSM